MKAVERYAVEAAAQSRYLSRSPCKHGHVGARYTRDHRCVVCALTRNREDKRRKRILTMLMFDRLAQQIYRQFAPANSPTWYRADPMARSEARRATRALLALLREPDERMLDAMAHAVAADGDLLTEWRAAVDAIAAEDPE